MESKNVFIATTLLLAVSSVTAQQKLLTVAESSDFQATAPYADVVSFCETLASETRVAHLTSMGRTHENRDIPLLILADPPIRNATEAKRDGRPVVFVMGNIHAGEVCGKEASLMLARDLVRGNSPLLKQLIIVLAPIYNADGNERFSTSNRPGQIGPAQGMGQRPNAMGLDLNRDHMKLESPEARALAGFMNRWEPIVAVDLHTTDGSFHRYRLTYDSPRHPATDPKLLTYGRDSFLPGISEQLKRKTGDLTYFYGNFDREHTAWHSYPAAPRYSTHYFGLRNCLGILSEAYAFATFKQRVVVTYHFVEQILQRVSKEHGAIRHHIATAQKNAAAAPEIAVQFEPARLGMVTVPAWKEDRAGRGRPVTDDDEEAEYEVTYYGVAKPTLMVRRPWAYAIPAKYEKVLRNLTGHGIITRALTSDAEVQAETFTVDSFETARREFQGHRMVSDVQVSSSVGATKLPAGTIIVVTEQPLARLIVNLLEPQSADGLCTWNFFDEDLKANAYPVRRIMERTRLPIGD